MQSSASWRARVGGVEVVDVAGRDERQIPLRSEPRERPEHGLLDLEPGVLELDVDVVPPEDLLEPVELGLGVLLAALDERARDAAREAAGERDQPVAWRSSSSQSTRGR